MVSSVVEIMKIPIFAENENVLHAVFLCKGFLPSGMGPGSLNVWSGFCCVILLHGCFASIYSERVYFERNAHSQMWRKILSIVRVVEV